jgi:hypothetical protein
MWRMRSSTTGTSSTLMPAVGSSNMKMSGSSASRMATSSLRLSPCERAEADSWRRSASAAVQVMLGLLDGLDVVRPQREQVQAQAGAALHRQPDVLQHRQVGEQVGQLEGAADAAARALRGAEVGDVLAVEPHAAGSRPAAGRTSG